MYLPYLDDQYEPLPVPAAGRYHDNLYCSHSVMRFHHTTCYQYDIRYEYRHDGIQHIQTLSMYLQYLEDQYSPLPVPAAGRYQDDH